VLDTALVKKLERKTLTNMPELLLVIAVVEHSQ